MPELPEVETTRRGITPHILHQPVMQVEIREARLRWPVPPHLPETLQGLTINTVERRAKYLLLGFSTGHLLIHLGMSGSLRLVDPTESAGKHDHVDLLLPEKALRYRDPRRFGAILWHIGPLFLHPLLKSLGPEPLAAEFDGEHLFRSSRHRQTAIKPLLMSNQPVVGVGNIYANEALFSAGINPTRPACSLDLADCTRLAMAIRETLARAIDAGGSTLRDFLGADSRPGYFQHSHLIYDRAGQPCVHCGTPIAHLRQAQRSTYYCPCCQPC